MRTFSRLLLWGAVLLVAGWFAARWAVGSSWGRDIAEHRIGRVLNLAVTIESARLDWPLLWTATGVKAQVPGRGDTTPAFVVQELQWDRMRRHALLRSPQVRLTQGPAGDWQPASLRHLGAAGQPAVPLMTILDRTAREIGFSGSFDLTHGLVVRSEDATDRPLLGGLDWSSRRVSLGEHGMAWHHRALLQTRHPRRQADDALVIEWLAVEARPPVLLWERSDRELDAPYTPAPERALPGADDPPETEPAGPVTNDPAAPASEAAPGTDPEPRPVLPGAEA